MFFVVGLTLDDVWAGALPQVRLAEVLEARKKQGKPRLETSQEVLVYTTDANDTQGLIARTKYKEQGAFLVFLYFSSGAVAACKELGVPLRILDQLEERALPMKKVKVLEHPSASPALK